MTGILKSHAVIVLAAVVGALLMLLFSAFERTSVVGQWQQPASIDYQSFDPYTLFLIEKQTGVLGSVTHEIQIMRGDKPDEYGHALEIRLTSLQASQVAWTTEGVTLSVASGHQLFFPKSAFTGGR